MSRVLFLLLTLSLFSAGLYAEDFDPTALPAVKKALDKATAEVARNRKAYDEANQKAFNEAKEAISKEVDRLSKAGKLEEAVAVKKFSESLSKQVLAKAETATAPPHPGKAGAVAWNGHKYKVFKEPCSWHDGKKRCEEMGGHLVIINDARENAFLLALLGRSGMPVDNARNNWTGVWIGLTDEAKEDEWLWVDGSALAYRNWVPGEPCEGRACNHAVLDIHYGGAWDDRSAPANSLIPAFICEWDD